MSDYRTKFTQELIENLSTHFASEQLQLITEVTTKVLANYDISEKCTQIVPRDDRNEKLIKKYMACLMVDGKSSKTMYVYSTVLRRFMEFINIPLQKVSTYDIRFFLASMKETGVSDRTLENYRAYISSFYQWMSREDFIAKNPCEKISPIKYKIEVRLPFSSTEIDSLRSACRTQKQRAILELLLSSGVRVDELANLDIEDLNLNSCAVHVREGKGKKERITYMSDLCAFHVKKYLEGRTDDKPELFLSQKKKKRILAGGIRNIVYTIGKSAGVENVHPHRFRRTFATNLSRRGMDVQTISKLMGHSNIDTTMIYVYEDKSRIAQEYNKYTA